MDFSQYGSEGSKFDDEWFSDSLEELSLLNGK